jgi:hypothetical protein
MSIISGGGWGCGVNCEVSTVMVMMVRLAD